MPALIAGRKDGYYYGMGNHKAKDAIHAELVSVATSRPHTTEEKTTGIGKVEGTPIKTDISLCGLTPRAPLFQWQTTTDRCMSID